MGIVANIRDAILKENRSQYIISQNEGDSIPSDRTWTFEQAYDRIEVVRRGVDLIVNSASEFNYDITEPIDNPQSRLMRRDEHIPSHLKIKTLQTLLNFASNPGEDVSKFRRLVFTDLVLTGNAFIYFDGAYIYHLPSKDMEIKTGKKEKVLGYLHNGKISYEPYEIIHISDNHASSVFRGKGRLFCTDKTLDILYNMLNFQRLFFKNGAVPGVVLSTPNVLNAKIKQQIVDNWRRSYSATAGAKTPMVLDGDFKFERITNVNFRELDFEISIEKHETKLLKALGIPPILLDGGNNANISPNLKMFYETTVSQLVNIVVHAFERFFAYDIEADVSKIRALRPDLREHSTYLVGLVNGGIITINEARKELRREESTEKHANELRIPANIAGSAGNPTEGGRPEGSTEDDEKNV